MKEKLIELLKMDKAAPDDQIVLAVGNIIGSHNKLVSEFEKLEVENRLLRATADTEQPVQLKVDSRIRQKMAAGLSFQQAVEVVASQDAADKQAKAEAKAAR